MALSDDIGNLILEYMRKFDTRLERVENDLGDIKGRMTSLEEQSVRTNRRLDRIDERVERIERRLDLVDV